MGFTWNANTPAANQSFSVSQGLIETNLGTLDSVENVDHYPYSTGGVLQGQHKQITLPANNVPGAQSGLVSTLYTNTGTALSSASQLFWRNSQSIFQVSAVRAWAKFDGGQPVGVITFSQGYNVTSITRSATAGVYNVVLSVGAVDSADFAVIVTGAIATPGTGTPTVAGVSTLAFGASGTFNINLLKLSDLTGTNGNPISFVVLQV